MRAKEWASRYDDADGATWFRPASNERYMARRLYDDGSREKGACGISVEETDDGS